MDQQAFAIGLHISARCIEYMPCYQAIVGFSFEDAYQIIPHYPSSIPTSSKRSRQPGFGVWLCCFQYVEHDMYGNLFERNMHRSFPNEDQSRSINLYHYHFIDATHRLTRRSCLLCHRNLLHDKFLTLKVMVLNTIIIDNDDDDDD